MRRGSRRALVIGLLFPVALSLLTAATILILIPQAPDTIAMQWSGDSASRSAPPAELLLLPAFALGTSALIWAIAPTGKPRDALLGLTVGNGLSTLLNISAVALLTGQLTGPASGALPVGALAVSFVAGVLASVGTFFAARPGLE